MKKKILITGGAGFIGSAIIAELGKEGHEVFVLDNLSFGNKGNLGDLPETNFYDVDILDKNSLERCFTSVKPQRVIHLAAIHFIPYCNAHPFLSSNINIQGTINVLNASEKCGSVEQFIFASTAAVYPVMSGAIKETTECSATDIYGLTKVAGEQFCFDFARKTGVTTISCRFFNAFGENETNPHLIPEIQVQLSKGVRKLSLGNLEPKRDYIHTSDIATAVRKLSDTFSGDYDVYNIGSGREYSVSEIVSAFEKSIGEEIIIEQDQTRIRKADRPHLLADISKLQQFISWQPSIDIFDGIDRLMKKQVVVR